MYRYGKIRILVISGAGANAQGIYYNGIAQSDMPHTGVGVYAPSLLEGGGKEYIGYVGISTSASIGGGLFTPGGALTPSTLATFASIAYLAN